MDPAIVCSYDRMETESSSFSSYLQDSCEFLGSDRLVTSRNLLPPLSCSFASYNGCGCGLTVCVVFAWVCTVSVPVSGPVPVGLTVCVVGPVGTGVGLVVVVVGVVVVEVGDVTLVFGVVEFGVTPMGGCTGTGVGFTGAGWTG